MLLLVWEVNRNVRGGVLGYFEGILQTSGVLDALMHVQFFSIRFYSTNGSTICTLYMWENDVKHPLMAVVDVPHRSTRHFNGSKHQVCSWNVGLCSIYLTYLGFSPLIQRNNVWYLFNGCDQMTLIVNKWLLLNSTVWKLSRINYENHGFFSICWNWLYSRPCIERYSAIRI